MELRHIWPVQEFLLIYLISAISLSAQNDSPTISLLAPRVVQQILDPTNITVLRLKPGYISAVRVPEDVNSVVLGNPSTFKAEHSESEPRLVFLKPIVPSPEETNALITTKTGKEISLHLISNGLSDRDGPIDFILEYATSRSVLVYDSRPDFIVAETHSLANVPVPKLDPQTDLDDRLAEFLKEKLLMPPHWRGKLLKVALGRVSDGKSEMIVVFSVQNASTKTIELLPPQVQLAGVPKSKHRGAITAAQLPVKNYRMLQRRLPPRSQTDVVLAFERPTFKEASEQILLQVAQAEEVDRPVLIPVPFVPLEDGGKK